tara:strand:+ start:479 stop:892 length:414 start_codon:yes stop_codon:yes gene_type:complete
MAIFTRTHGNAQQVFHVDTNNGSLSGALAESAPVNVAGPKLAFFKLLINDGSAVDLQAQVGTGLGVEAILQDIQTKSTVAIYQVEDDTTGQISVALYPTDAYTAATLQTQIRLLTAAGSTPIDCSSSTAADAGMKLA